MDILAHLIVGSEGTLGFVAEAVFRTVPLLHARRHRRCWCSRTWRPPTRALPALVATGAATIELMDARRCGWARRSPGAPAVVRDLTVRDHAALLVEYQADSAEQLAELQRPRRSTCWAVCRCRAPAAFTADARDRAPAVAAAQGPLRRRSPGPGRRAPPRCSRTSWCRCPRSGRTCGELIRLFDQYSYSDSVIFGHAKDGNIHFMLTDGFAAEDELDRYSALHRGHGGPGARPTGGSLKAEHGTGRVMAPYVRRQYGDELYDVMRELKRLFDPRRHAQPRRPAWTRTRRRTCAHIKTAPPVEPRRWTAASYAATASRCAPAGTSP